MTSKRYGMVIDIKKCIGCNACTIGCKSENGTSPGIFWSKVLEKEVGKYPSTRIMFLPVLCNHCEKPPCRDVCPTAATYTREDGIVLVDYNKCMGCRACITVCPYEARYYLKERESYYPTGFTPYEDYKNEEKKFQEGVTQKCTFCYERVDKGLEPACVYTCPTECRHFGDLNDSNDQVSRLINERGGSQLRPEEGTNPSVFYVS